MSVYRTIQNMILFSTPIYFQCIPNIMQNFLWIGGFHSLFISYYGPELRAEDPIATTLWHRHTVTQLAAPGDGTGRFLLSTEARERTGAVPLSLSKRHGSAKVEPAV